jgi:hypothetical protein
MKKSDQSRWDRFEGVYAEIKAIGVLWLGVHEIWLGKATRGMYDMIRCEEKGGVCFGA